MEHIETRRVRRRRGGRKGARGLAIALALAAALAVTLVASGLGDGADPAPITASTPAPAPITASEPAPAPVEAPAAVPVSVRVDMGQQGRPVPARFLGLSFEASSLPQIAAYASAGDLVALLRSLGPGMLRFGGVSADTRIAWSDSATPAPTWTSAVLRAGDLRSLGALAARSGWRVLLTVGLAHYEPRAAAREVAVARAALGASLAGIEVGNEPDAYARHGLRRPPWNPARYNAEVRAYRRAIARLAPGVPLAGPGVSGSHSFVSWGRAVARAQRPALLTGHHYPLGCHQTPAPSIAGLLSTDTRRLAASSLARYLSVSRRTRIPFRMDEAGSVSCGGRPGISDTFASALWATDYITQAMTAGAAGINLQGNPANCLGYSPVCAAGAATLARGALTPQPVWYALLLTSTLVGDRPLPTTVAPAQQQPQQPNIAVRTLRAPDGSLRFVIVEEDPPGSPPVAVNLHVGGGFDSATVLSLRAPSPEATSGVTLGGRAVAADGSFARPAGEGPLPASGGVITVTLAPSSAALVTASPAAGAAG
jgi:hypothetical protein